MGGMSGVDGKLTAGRGEWERGERGSCLCVCVFFCSV